MSRSVSYGSFIAPIIFVAALVYAWTATNPATIGPAGILFVFILLYGFWVSIFFLFVRSAAWFVEHIGLFKTRGVIQRAPLKPYYIASILAFAPVLIIAIQSVNQLTLKDVGLVIAFISLAIFYIFKRA